MIDTTDIELLKSKGIAKEVLDAQIKRFSSGFKPLNVLRPALVDDGIIRLNSRQTEDYVAIFTSQLEAGVYPAKFVPASGAASRMFKDLYAYLDNPVPLTTLPETAPVVKFIKELPRFAFFPLLERGLSSYNLNDVEVRKSQAANIISWLLGKEGLNYGFLPKGLVHFHSYKDTIRTAMEEHLAEGASYAANADKVVRVHFTISPEHEEFFKKQVLNEGPAIEKMYGIKLEVSFSFQKPHSDTIAVTPDNKPFRDEKGQLLFRPGGHGALIENLNEQNSDIIFIKNIDNVVPKHLLDTTIKYKKAFGGLLLDLRSKLFSFQERLDLAKDDKLIDEVRDFIKKELFVSLTDDFNSMSLEDKHGYLKAFLNRPFRICGMVNNEGEPGGGPFWVKGDKGQESLQILESSQIDMSQPAQAKILEASTHFNPVDLVCSIKNYKGEKFDLMQYTDPETGFISEKSYNGRALKALELPGLWNGAMADWITLFVEVPIETFNPVKSVNDLLRKQHQPE